MIDLTPEAKQRFDDYLRRMRSALRGSRAVEPDEVEQNVIEHVDVALAGTPAPIGAERLGEVLAQLGPPEQWLPDDERPAWRKMMDRVMNGPEDWRLAYLSFALTALMILSLPIGGILLLLPAFILSRAYVELLEQRGEPIGARRWLVLPPIVLLLVMICGIALIAPAAAFGAMLGEGTLREFGLDFESRPDRVKVFSGMLTMAAGIWWIILSGVFAMLMTPFRALFAPVTSRLRRGHALVLTIAGLVLAGIGGLLLLV
jgi:hypothetical protein